MNGIVYYKTRRIIEMELSAIQYFSSVLWCCNKICKIKGFEFNPFFNELKQSYEIFKPLRSKTAGMLQKGFSDMDVLAEYIKIIFLSDIRNYNKVIHKISKYSDDFHKLYKSIGEIDLAICVLSFRESIPFYCTPKFYDENSIQFQDVYHPLILSPIFNSGAIKNFIIIYAVSGNGGMEINMNIQIEPIVIEQKSGIMSRKGTN